MGFRQHYEELKDVVDKQVKESLELHLKERVEVIGQEAKDLRSFTSSLFQNA